MLRPVFLPLALLALTLASCSHADSASSDEASSAGGSGGSGGQAGSSSMACAAGQQIGCACVGDQASGVQVCKGDGSGFGPCTGCPSGHGGSGGTAGSGGSGGSGGTAQGGAAGSSGNTFGGGGEAGSGASAGGSSGAGGGPFGGGGEAGMSGSSGGPGGTGGAAGSGGTAGSGGSGGTAGSGAAPGWACGESQYATGGKWPACNCDCGAYDPDCDDPDSYLKGCDTGQTCGKDGTCQGKVLYPPSSWVCGSAYYGIGGQVPVCNCGCGAPDPDCDLPHPTYDLTKCKKGQTCGADGTCQGPELAVPSDWICAPSKFAEGKTSGTCDCGCGAPDPDCHDLNLKITGCGYMQTCSDKGTCQGDIAPAPAGWTCASNAYSDGKICNCACGIRDPDCDLDLPDDCGPDAFCGSITNDCIPKAN